MNELAQRLRTHRGTSSQQLIGDAIGIHKNFVSMIETGKRLPKRPEHIKGIADVLGVHVDQVYAWMGQTPPDIINHLNGNYAAVQRLRMLEGL